MLTCPRCGFVQPDDRFCAQCGLDVSRYKPSKSFVEKLTTNLAVQLLFILCLVGTTTYVIFERKRASILQAQQQVTVPPITATPPAQTQEPAAVDSPRTLDTKTSASVVTASAINHIEPQTRSKAAPTNANTESLVASEDDATETPVDKKPTLVGFRISVFGFPISQIPQLTETAKSMGSSSSAKAYWIKNWSQSLQKLRDSQGDILDLDSGNVTLSGNSTVGWDRMSLDPTTNHEAGVSISFVPSASDSARFSLKLERSLRDTKSTSPQAQDSISWTLDNINVTQNGEAMLIVSILPRRKLTPQEEVFLAPTFLRFMAAPEFQDGMLDVGLLVEPQLQP